MQLVFIAEENWQDEKCIRCKCKQGIGELTENEMSENDIVENGFFGQNGHVRAATDSPPEVYDNLQIERSLFAIRSFFFLTNKSKSGDGEFLLTMCKLLLCLQYSSDYIFFLMFECEYFRKFDFSFVLCNLLISIEYEIIN